MANHFFEKKWNFKISKKIFFLDRSKNHFFFKELALISVIVQFFKETCTNICHRQIFLKKFELFSWQIWIISRSLSMGETLFDRDSSGKCFQNQGAKQTLPTKRTTLFGGNVCWAPWFWKRFSDESRSKSISPILRLREKVEICHENSANVFTKISAYNRY